MWILLDSARMTSGQLYLTGSVKNIELMAQVWPLFLAIRKEMEWP